MNANFIISETTGNQQQQPISIHSFHNQMHSLPAGHIAHSAETETNFYFQQNQFNASQGQMDTMKMNNANESNGNVPNGFLRENDVTIQRQQQQMAVSSPSVSSTADLNAGLGNGQNGMRYGVFCGGSQQMDSTNFVLQQPTVEDGGGNGDFCGIPQPNTMRQSLHFATMNGQFLNGQNSGACFPPNLPPSAIVPTNVLQRRTFLFNSDMANNAVKSVQQRLTDDMAGWHLKHCPIVPSTSRAAFEPKRAVNINNCANNSRVRGIKRKASIVQSTADTQQPHSMSLSPHDVQPPSYTSSVGHPQSAPVMSNQFDQPQHSNELCDSSTNSDVEMFKGLSGHLHPNGSMPNYMQNGLIGQMDENPLKKMEIMTSKTLNEPTNGRIQRFEDGTDQNHQTMLGAADASKQEKMDRLHEIEKALLPFETSPSYPNPGPFPDSTHQFRPHLFAPSGQMIQQSHAHFCAVRPLMGSFPQNPSLKMAAIHPNHQMYNPMGEHPAVMQNVTDGVTMTIDGNATSQQSWATQ